MMVLAILTFASLSFVWYNSLNLVRVQRGMISVIVATKKVGIVEICFLMIFFFQKIRYLK